MKSSSIMKSTLLFATLSMVLASPTAFAKSELEMLRSRCSDQERQIRQLENDNTKLRADGREARPAPAKAEAAAKPEVKKPERSSSNERTYTVRAGDSMEKIGRKVGTNPEKLAKANGLKTSSIIHPGLKLKVPGANQAPTKEVAVAKATPAPAKRTAAPVEREETTMISTPVSREKVQAPIAKAPAPAAPAMKAAAPSSMAVKETPAPKVAPIPAPAPIRETKPEPAKTPLAAASIPAPATLPAAPEKEVAAVPEAQQKIHAVTVDGEMTYGDFANKHGTDTGRLNALNGLDLTTATVLAKGSELYVPASL
jgi:LysM repeat protein